MFYGVRGNKEGHIKGPRVKLEGHVDAIVEDAKITVKLHIEKEEP